MAYRDRYICSDCGHEWQTRKKRGSPPSCPNCNSKDITNESEEERKIIENSHLKEGSFTVSDEGKLERMSAECPKCGALIEREIKEDEFPIDATCEECGERWSISGNNPLNDSRQMYPEDKISRQIEEYDLEITRKMYRDLILEYKRKLGIYTAIGAWSIIIGIVIFLRGNDYGVLVSSIPIIISKLTNHYFLRIFLPEEILKLPKEIREEWIDSDVESEFETDAFYYDNLN